jgi:D-arginine dehydrogenase
VTERRVIVVGAGIAGASLAYFLAHRGSCAVTVLEREDQPGAHATGRSAAALVELDPEPVAQHLKVLSAPFLRSPPEGFTEGAIVTPSGVLVIYAGRQWEHVRNSMDRYAEEGIRAQALSAGEAAERVGVLDPRSFDGAVLLADDGEVDVHALLWGYLRGARRAGARVETGVSVTGVVRRGDSCAGVVTTSGEREADVVVNAAGAWAGIVGRMAGARPIDFRPLRRCAMLFDAPPGVDPGGWPMVKSEHHRVYFKPDADRILFSPMDEGACEPCDAAADEIAIAEGVERLRELAPGLVPRSAGRRWAGLRTFSPDGVPIVGEDPSLPGFFWLAGQGGFGIVTSPALGRIAADLVLDGLTAEIDAATLSPARL